MYNTIYELGKERMYSRLNEALDNINLEIENGQVEPIGYDAFNNEAIYPEASDFEEEIWEDLIDSALNQCFTNEEMYFAIYETDGEKDADWFWNDWDPVRGEVA